jgi:hypothetical protein
MSECGAVRSSVTVGQDAMVEMVVGPRSPVDANGRWWPWDEDEEPARSMDAAAEVVDAIAAAAGGSGWLCVPSYVVIRIDMSSAHRCTCFLTGQDGATVHR